MFTAEVYRVLVHSIGITQEECIALKVLGDWNAIQGESNGKVYIPMKQTEENNRSQEVDVVIGIVGSYILEQEVIKDYVKVGKKVLLFFNTFFDESNSIKSEMKEVESFKEQMKSHCFCIDYYGLSRFANALIEILNTI